MKNIKYAVFVISLIVAISYSTEEKTCYTYDRGYINLETNVEQVVENTTEPQEKVTGYIFIGDSRFVAMNNVCDICEKENMFLVAKESEGYDYLVNTAIHESKKIIQSNNDITDWKCIICLGVNDLYNIDKYIETYNKLKEEYDLVLVSVNPIEYHSTITNKKIEEFNNSIKNIENIQYIDSYKYLTNKGFKTTDGLHYTNNTYKDIYKAIEDSLNESLV